MRYDPNKHHPPEDETWRTGRRSIRLKDYDYSTEGGYFVTIDTFNRDCIFGKIADETMSLNESGKIVNECWHAIPNHFPHVELDEFVIMPDHVHGIIIIVGERYSVGARHAVPLHNNIPQREQFGKPTRGTLPTIIRSFKSAATKRINEIRNSQAEPVWQRNYYEHIIRNEEELIRIREYIYNNPARWRRDEEII
jgi:putative transposase